MYFALEHNNEYIYFDDLKCKLDFNDDGLSFLSDNKHEIIKLVTKVILVDVCALLKNAYLVIMGELQILILSFHFHIYEVHL